jgi:hypothetical protein
MRRHQVALWAGVAAFFSTVLAIGAIDILNPNDRVQFLGGVLVGMVTAGAVYSKQRLDDEKKGIERHGGSLVVKEVGDKKVFSLELEDDPEILETKNEVTFKVVRTE